MKENSRGTLRGVLLLGPLAFATTLAAGENCNTPPQATSDTVLVGYGSSHLFDPIRNDSDADGDPLLLALIDNPAVACSGQLVPLGDQLVRFVPTGQALPGGGLSCTASYSVGDGHSQDSGLVTLVFPDSTIFSDGFESGSTGAWAEVVTDP